MWCWTGTTPGVFLIHSRAAPWHIRADVCRLVWKTQWWLGVCANLTGLKDTQIASKIFLSVSVTVSPEGINVGINKLDRDYPHQCGWASSNLARTWIEEGRGRANLLFLSWDIQLSAFGHWHSWLLDLGTQIYITNLVFRPSDLGWITPPVINVKWGLTIYPIGSVFLGNPN